MTNYTQDMDPRDIRSIAEHPRRGIWESERTMQPHHPALAQILTPKSARALLQNLQTGVFGRKSHRLCRVCRA